MTANTHTDPTAPYGRDAWCEARDLRAHWRAPVNLLRPATVSASLSAIVAREILAQGFNPANVVIDAIADSLSANRHDYPDLTRGYDALDPTAPASVRPGSAAYNFLAASPGYLRLLNEQAATDPQCVVNFARWAGMTRAQTASGLARHCSRFFS